MLLKYLLLLKIGYEVYLSTCTCINILTCVVTPCFRPRKEEVVVFRHLFVYVCVIYDTLLLMIIIYCYYNYYCVLCYHNSYYCVMMRSRIVSTMIIIVVINFINNNNKTYIDCYCCSSSLY